VSCSLAGTTGVHEGADASKLLLVGADVAMTTSALLRHGSQHIATMLTWIGEWMTTREYVSIDQLKGSVSRRNIRDPASYERANYYQDAAELACVLASATCARGHARDDDSGVPTGCTTAVWRSDLRGVQSGLGE
jgi:hypothetical protein